MDGRTWRVLAGVVLALGLAEAMIPRLGHFRYSWDPDLGEIFDPGSRFAKWGEGDGSGVFSSHGTRVSCPSRGRGADRKPILVLGDSYAEALQVADDELFSNVLAKLLDSDGIPVRVTNAGRSAYSMADYACRANVFERLFEPSWVVVQLNDGDFSGDAFTPQHGFARFRRQGDSLECVGPTLPAPPGTRSPIRRLVHEARTRFGLPDALWASLRARVGADEAGLPLFSAGQALAASTPSLPTDEPPIEQELTLLRSAWGPRLTLLYLPHFDPSDETRAGVIEARAAAAATKVGIRFRSLREEFPDLARRRIVPYGFSNTRLNVGHWNAEGHAAAARILRRDFLYLRAHGLF